MTGGLTLCETGHITSSTELATTSGRRDYPRLGEHELFRPHQISCRGRLAQLTTTSQAVDGQPPQFDNAISVEYSRRGASWDRRLFGCTAAIWIAGLMKIRLVLFVTLIFAIASTASSFAAGGRYALVVGNAKYPDAEAPLKDPIHDARDVADELKRDGIHV